MLKLLEVLKITYMVLQRKEKIFYVTIKNSQQTKSKIKLYVFYN